MVNIHVYPPHVPSQRLKSDLVFLPGTGLLEVKMPVARRQNVESQMSNVKMPGERRQKPVVNCHLPGLKYLGFSSLQNELNFFPFNILYKSLVSYPASPAQLQHQTLMHTYKNSFIAQVESNLFIQLVSGGGPGPGWSQRVLAILRVSKNQGRVALLNFDNINACNDTSKICKY